MKFITPLLLAASLPSLATAQQVDPAAAWHAFTAEHGTSWQVQWNPATGTPSAIYGPGLQLGHEIADHASARRAANALLDRYASLLGRGESTFVETIGVKARQVYVFVYQQQYRGLPVISGRADIRLHEIGTVAMFGASTIRIANGFNTTPVISAGRARDIVEMEVLGETSTAAEAARQGAPRLVIWGEAQSQAKTTATLAWEVQIDARPTQVAVGKSYVDAQTGTVLEFKNEVYECGCGATHIVGNDTHPAGKRLDHAMARAAVLRSAAPTAPKVALTGRVMGWTNLGVLPVSPLTNTPLANLLVTSSAGNAYTDADGKFSIPYTGTSPVTVSANLTGRHTRRVINAVNNGGMVVSTSITPGTAGVIQFGNQSMGENQYSQTSTYWHVNDANVWLRGLLPSATGPMNTISAIAPRVNINSNCNAYYTRNTINFYTSGGGCNMTAFQTVIYHEWGHGLDSVFGGISQTDGLSEGWGDIIALYRSGQSELGPGFRTGSTTGLRSGNNTLRYPQSGSVHTMGQTWMGFAWDLRKNLIATHGPTTGIATAEQIVVASIAANAANQPNAVREVFILDDNDGNLNNGTPNYLDLQKAALNRNLPYPKRSSPNPASFTLFGVGCKGTGTGSATCLSNNTNGGTLSNNSSSNEYAYLVANASTRSITGFEVYTASSASSSINVRTAIYLDNGSGAPRTTPFATGTMKVGTTPAFYRSSITANIPAGRFYVSLDHSAGAYLAQLNSGTSGRAYWRRPPMGTGSFALSGVVTRSSFRILCSGGGSSAIPLLAHNGLPEIGFSYDITLSQGRPNSPATLLNGLSNTTWAAGALPYDLGPLGAPTCKLLIDPSWPIPLNTDSQGRTRVTVPLPNITAYIGIKMYHQFYVVDAGANALQVAVSGGAESKVGQR